MSDFFPLLDRAGDRTALRAGDDSVTWRELAAACHRHAAALARDGVRPGDRRPVLAEPSLSSLIELVGNLAYGAVSVPLSPSLGRAEREHILRDSAGGDLPDGTALVLYTSGTTGPPKGVALTRAALAANLDALADAWQWSERDTVVTALPVFHVHGLVLGLFGSLRAGGAVHHVGRFAPDAIASGLEQAAARGGAVLFAVPTMYHRLLDAAGTDAAVRGALAGARLLVSGSAGLPLREHRRAESALGRGIHERYGLTETLINTAVRADGPPQPGTVGPPLRGVELALLDEQRRPLGEPDAVGQVAVRGPNLFAGYLGNPAATAAAVDGEGWFHTGDLATRAAGGAVRILGRRSTDLIKTGGYKVGAGEVEACLLELPGVRQVAVVGMADDDLGERIVAFVVAADPSAPPPAQQLSDHVAAELAAHKRPREVRFVDDLPRNAMGKVQKQRLRGGG